MKLGIGFGGIVFIWGILQAETPWPKELKKRFFLQPAGESEFLCRDQEASQEKMYYRIEAKKITRSEDMLMTNADGLQRELIYLAKDRKNVCVQRRGGQFFLVVDPESQVEDRKYE